MRTRWRCALCPAFGRISADPGRDFHAHYLEVHYEAPK